jgi:hypothetical protein
MRQAAFERVRPRSWARPKRFLVGVCAFAFAVGLAACAASDDAISFVEYIEATGDVLEANGIDADFDLDCDGSRETKNVTCTAESSEGQRIESTGEKLGEDNATLVVRVDGEVLFDGLLEEARGS